MAKTIRALGYSHCVYICFATEVYSQTAVVRKIANSLIKSRVKLSGIITFFLLLASLHGQCQSVRPVDSIEIVKKLIRQNGTVESFYLGLHGKPSKQCLRFLFIAKRSSVEDIETLINDSSTSLKVYAYSYLRCMYKMNLRTVKLALQKDSSQIYFMSDCVGGNTEVRYILKRIKQWETAERFKMWMKNYSEFENKWNSFLLVE